MSQGNHQWSQKFAVATLPTFQQIDRWDPLISGVVGAEPGSRFAEAHPQFGIAPRPTSAGMQYNFLLDPFALNGVAKNVLYTLYPGLVVGESKRPVFLLVAISM
jgi:hypothetical protein